MVVDVEAGSRRDDAPEQFESTLEEPGNEEEGEDDLSGHPSSSDGGVQCLCKQFERNSFCRRLQEEAHVECQWYLSIARATAYCGSVCLAASLCYESLRGGASRCWCCKLSGICQLHARVQLSWFNMRFSYTVACPVPLEQP